MMRMMALMLGCWGRNELVDMETVSRVNTLYSILILHYFSPCPTDAAPDGSAGRSGGGGGGISGDGNEATTITSLVVPEYVMRGQDAVLRCDWKISGEIYSIKWYFNDREFFAYKPGDSPEYSHSTLYGIKVAVSE